MDDVRLLGLVTLRERLRAAFPEDILIIRQLDRALVERDPDLLAAAMDSLRLYPAPVREGVEAVIVDWLMAGPVQRLTALHA